MRACGSGSFGGRRGRKYRMKDDFWRESSSSRPRKEKTKSRRAPTSCRLVINRRNVLHNRPQESRVNKTRFHVKKQRQKERKIPRRGEEGESQKSKSNSPSSCTASCLRRRARRSGWRSCRGGGARRAMARAARSRRPPGPPRPRASCTSPSS